MAKIKNRTIFKDGSYKKFPHRSVVGDKSCLYLWMADSKHSGEASRWLKGVEAFSFANELLSMKSKKEQIEFFDKKYKSLERM